MMSFASSTRVPAPSAQDQRRAMSSHASAPPIVLVHGLWLTPRSWEGWKERFERRGHQVLAPAWPRMQQEVEELRRDPSALNGLGVGDQFRFG